MMTARSDVIRAKRRNNHRARCGLAINPKLLPNSTIVSNTPRPPWSCVMDKTRASRTPRSLAVSTASGELSTASTEWPRCCKWSATRPGPQPMSRTRPRTNAIARR